MLLSNVPGAPLSNWLSTHSLFGFVLSRHPCSIGGVIEQNRIFDFIVNALGVPD